MSIKSKILKMINKNQYSILSPTQFYRLGGCQRALLESLDDLGSCHLQVRNAGGGIDRQVNSVSMVIDESEGIAFDPENGITLELDQWIATHATEMNVGGIVVPTLDFEFACQTAGLCLAEIPKNSSQGFVAAMVEKFGGMPVSPDDLADWRNEICPPFTMCSKCFESAQRRAKTPQQHPLYGILTHLEVLEKPFHCHLFGEHAEMSVWINPQQISTLNGFLVVMDEDQDITLHIETAMAHAFRLQKKTIDGEKWATVQIHDSHGNMNFQLAVDEPDLISSWQWICDSMDSSFKQIDEQTQN